GERCDPQAVLQGEGPHPASAGEPGVSAAVLRRRSDPRQADRGDSKARLAAGRPERPITERSGACPQGFHRPPTGQAKSVDEVRGQVPSGHTGPDVTLKVTRSAVTIEVPVIDRLPPQSLEAEQSVLGAILIDRDAVRSEEHTSELQSRFDLVCRLLLEK